MAILALLSGLLLPALLAGKDRGKSLVCQSNLKQNAASTLVFVQTQDQFPYGFSSNMGFSSAPPGGFIGDAADDWRGWWWFHQISESKNPRLDASIRCPSHIQTDNLLCGNYGANYAVFKIGDLAEGEISEFQGEALKASRLTRPGRTIILTDSGYALISWKATLPEDELAFENPKRKGSFFLPGLASNARRTIAPAQQNDALKGRHYGHSVNVAFGDGHVRSLKASNLATEDPEEGRLYLWLP